MTLPTPLSDSMATQSHTTPEVGIYSQFNLSAIVVDDTKTVLKLMEKVLLRVGFQSVQCYENGSRGLEALMQQQVDIVFSDVQMPIMTGPEVTTRLMHTLHYVQHSVLECALSLLLLIYELLLMYQCVDGAALSSLRKGAD